jgi:signal transduction histidine kinase
MATRIEQVVLDQRALLQAISHELRSPLGRALVNVELARDRSGKADPALDKIEHEIANIDAILRDLLFAARTGLSELHRESVVLEPWLREVIATESNGLTLELVSGTRVTKASFDAALMKRALANLIRNAARHGHPEGAALRLELGGDEMLEFAVVDAGPGFSPDFLERAFEPFTRGDHARAPSSDGGTGLGLALVRRIAEAHGGSCGAANVFEGNKTCGARVWIRIPISGSGSCSGPGLT